MGSRRERFRAWRERKAHERLRAAQRAAGVHVLDLADVPLPIPAGSPLPPPIGFSIVRQRCPHCGEMIER